MAPINAVSGSRRGDRARTSNEAISSSTWRFRCPHPPEPAAEIVQQRLQRLRLLANFAVIWRGDAIRDLGTLAGDRFSRAVAINGQGQVVGWSRATWSSEAHGVLWSAGQQPIDLGRGQAVAVNERGQILGSHYLWEDGRREPVDIDYPSAINNRGQIVGQTNDYAVVWQKGHAARLPGLGGKGSWATDINDGGQIVGWATTKNGAQHAVLWARQP